LFVGAQGLWQLRDAQQRMELVQTRLIPSVSAINAAKAAVSDSRLAGYRLSVFSNLSDKSALDKAYNDAHANFDKVLADYAKNNIFDETDRKMLEQTRPPWRPTARPWCHSWPLRTRATWTACVPPWWPGRRWRWARPA